MSCPSYLPSLSHFVGYSYSSQVDDYDPAFASSSIIGIILASMLSADSFGHIRNSYAIFFYLFVVLAVDFDYEGRMQIIAPSFTWKACAISRGARKFNLFFYLYFLRILRFALRFNLDHQLTNLPLQLLLTLQSSRKFIEVRE